MKIHVRHFSEQKKTEADGKSRLNKREFSSNDEIISAQERIQVFGSVPAELIEIGIRKRDVNE